MKRPGQRQGHERVVLLQGLCFEESLSKSLVQWVYYRRYFCITQKCCTDIPWWYFYCYISQTRAWSLGIDKNSRKPCEKGRGGREREREWFLSYFSLSPQISFILKHSMGMEIPNHIMKQTILERDKYAQKMVLVRTG